MITNSQSAFVKGRFLVENVLLATELIQGFNKETITPRGLLQVDLRKAFDTVSWEFILNTLTAAHFPAKFVNWIKECISTTSFSVNINGSLCGHFSGNRGLRQGDPLSPSLFLIVMEALTNILKRKKEEGSLKLHPLCVRPEITHLSFADDVMIFFDGSHHSLQGISSALDIFHSISGLEVNKGKTSLFVAGLTVHEEILINSLGYVHGTLPVRYLGLPLLHSKLKISDYRPLIDKVSQRLNNWTVKHLSFAGRLQLLSSVIYSITNFWMGAFLIPKGCIHRIVQLCSRFLWGGDASKKASVKVSWKDITLPKEEGGLGLRDLFVWNKVLLLRLIWILFSNGGSLWVAWTKEHRLKRGNFWSVKPTLNSSSWLWRSLLHLRPIAKSFIGCNIGNGCTISFWYDNWSTIGPLIDIMGEDAPRRLGIQRQATLAHVSSDSGWHNLVQRGRTQEQRTLLNILEQTQPPCHSAAPDVYTWRVNNSINRTFNTKQNWEQLRPSSDKKTWATTVWFKGAIPKYAFNFWIANLDKLPLRSRLAAWGMNVSPNCCLCSLYSETRDHLFLRCEMVEELWESLMTKLGLLPCVFGDWNVLLNWLRAGASPRKLQLRKLTTQVLIYLIWKERNERLHNGSSSPNSVIFLRLDRIIRDILLARHRRNSFKNLLSLWFTYD